MSVRRDSPFEVLGDPPQAVRATEELPSAAVAQMLSAPSTPALLELLGITGDDHSELSALIGPALADPEILAEITRAANLLRVSAGLEAPAAALDTVKEQHNALQRRLAPGEGLLSILALVVSTSTVRAWHRERGLSTEQSWEVLADLGQQMRVHRRSSGRLGLHQLAWMALNWRGRLVHLGRLQFDLHRTEKGTENERWVIGAHIPATGPLDPTAVEESFSQATAYFSTHYADLDTARPPGAVPFGHEFLCDSWLVNPVLTEELGADSNLGAFARRWELLSSERSDEGAAFFVFGQRPPYDAAGLPRRTRLERLVAERLEDGRGWESGHGRLVRQRPAGAQGQKTPSASS
ncbi:acyltransferase domain-containing protein [Brachybacterium paraconglomeratum]|uniref:acyltransferase domain-containing protein n=1 Tax=Brachybacterium paraconglomeratum TaxID=173362 RepID=UPI0031E6CFF8